MQCQDYKPPVRKKIKIIEMYQWTQQGYGWLKKKVLIMYKIEKIRCSELSTCTWYKILLLIGEKKSHHILPWWAHHKVALKSVNIQFPFTY